MATTAYPTETGMELHDLLPDHDFSVRVAKPRPTNREADALRRLSRVFASSPETILQELVNIAVSSSNADSAGISLEVPHVDPDQAQFRWVAIAGSFSHFLNGTTPRFFSPCGTCLDRNTPQYYRVTKAFYDYLGIQAEPIVDGLLIPWKAGDTRGTLWIVSHTDPEAFDLNDYNLMASLADFAAIAVRHRNQQDALIRQAQLAATNQTANTLAHRINNPLQSLMNTAFLAAEGGGDALNFARRVTIDIDILAAVVQTLLTDPLIENAILTGRVGTA